MKKYRFLIELAVIFAVYDCINVIFLKADMGFMKLPIHPYWVAVLLMPVFYGIRGGLSAGIMASAHYLFFYFKTMPDRTDIEQLIESGGFLLPLSFFIVGLVLGAVRQASMNNEEALSSLLEDAREKEGLLNERCEALKKSQKILEARIVGAATTVKTLYEASRKLESMDLEDIYGGCLEIMNEHFSVTKASLYIKEGTYFIVKSHKGWTEKEVVEGKIPASKSVMSLSIAENKVVTAKDIIARKEYTDQHGKVLSIFPLRNNRGEPIGVVNIEEMDFIAYNKANLDMIELVIDWVGRALYNKELYHKAMSKVIKDEELDIYSYSYFEGLIELEFKRAKKYGLPLTLSVLKVNGYGFLNHDTQGLIEKAVVALLKKHISGIDLCFRNKYDGTFFVLSPMAHEFEVKEELDKARSEFSIIISGYKMNRGKVELDVTALEISDKETLCSGFVKNANKKAGIKV